MQLVKSGLGVSKVDFQGTRVGLDGSGCSVDVRPGQVQRALIMPGASCQGSWPDHDAVRHGTPVASRDAQAVPRDGP